MMYRIPRKHKCECLQCNPYLLPDYDINSPLIHSREKCKTFFQVQDKGKNVGYTSGITKEGLEGFYLFAGINTEDIHIHKCGNTENVCLELRFGNITVVHDGIPIQTG